MEGQRSGCGGSRKCDRCAPTPLGLPPPPRAGPWESAGRDRGGGGHSGDGQSRTGPGKCASSWLAMATDQVGWRSNQNHRQKNPNCTKARRLARAGGGPGGLPGGPTAATPLPPPRDMLHVSPGVAVTPPSLPHSAPCGGGPPGVPVLPTLGPGLGAGGSWAGPPSLTFI